MPTVGEQLRTAREARGLRIQDVAEATNMRSDHILALEEGNYAPFPAPVYIRGSVRTYAKLLKLDVTAVMNALSAELDHAGDPDGASSGTLRRRGWLDKLALLLAQFGWKRGGALIVLAVVGLLVWLAVSSWKQQSRQDPLEDLPPPRYESGQSDQGAYLPLPGTNR